MIGFKPQKESGGRCRNFRIKIPDFNLNWNRGENRMKFSGHRRGKSGKASIQMKLSGKRTLFQATSGESVCSIK
jgi:hypothetical protein